MMMSDEDTSEVERGEGDIVERIIVPDDVEDAGPDQYEGDLDEDESSNDGTPTPIM